MIAYRLLRAGKHKVHVRKGREWLPVETGVPDDEGKEIIIQSGSIPDYFDDYFFDALELFETVELFGSLPFSGGWAEQPYPIFRVLQILKKEAARWEQKELEASWHEKKH